MPKYQWEKLTTTQKWSVFIREAEMETRNATTKEDLENILKFLYEECRIIPPKI